MPIVQKMQSLKVANGHDSPFKGKVAIVTGSSSGIGREAADIFASGGASVTLHGQSADKIKDAIKLLKSHGVPDSRIHYVLGPIEDEKTQKKLIDETVKKFGRLDILVNNAGISHRSGLDPNSLQNLDYVMNVNVKSGINLLRLAVPYLQKTKGNCVNVTAIVADRVFVHSQMYALSKAAQEHFTRNAAIEFCDRGIRVNAVSPGGTVTSFNTRHSSGAPLETPQVKRIIDEVIPMHRFGTAREIANAIEFLASDKASYITGASLTVDGGVMAGEPVGKMPWLKAGKE